MRTSRLHIALNLHEGESLDLPSEASHYLGKVLRTKIDDSVNLFNANDGEFSCLVTAVSKSKVTVQIKSRIENSISTVSTLQTHLGLGLSRGERMDFAIQKSTELGVSEITPLFTTRSEVKLNSERALKRQIHWQKIAVSASEQCGRLTIPLIHLPMTLSDWLDKCSAESRLVFDGGGAALSDLMLDDAVPSDATKDSETLQPKSIELVVGPEGGLDAEEVFNCEKATFQRVKLGPRILRTETAPIAALTVLQYLYGDFKPQF